MHSIIIADDEKFICDGIRFVIESDIPELIIAQTFDDGHTLYEYLGSHQSDILILDIEMPGKTGLEIAQFIEDQGHKCYVIMITAHKNFEYAKAAIDAKVDAFLTKPFSAQQLILAIRKAISYIDEQRASKMNHWSSHRSLLQALFNNKADTLLFMETFLCNSTIKLNQLHCAELSFQDEGILSLSVEDMTSLINSFTNCVENDTINQSSFFIGRDNDCFIVLVFYKEELCLEFVSNAAKIISNYTCNNTQHICNTYQSLSEYRIQKQFLSEMNAFFTTFAEHGAIKAKKQLIAYINSLTSHQYRNFKYFLSEHYNTTITEQQSDTVDKELDSLISHSMGNNSNNYLVDAAKEYIHKNYTKSSLSLFEIADALSISNNYLSKIFTKYTGKNLSEYLLDIRMSHAQELLRTTHLSTIEIAATVGYNYPGYFRSSFKTYYGITPRQYRMLQSQDD